MKYGLVGEKLGHSFSKILHGMLGDYPYRLCEVARDEIDAFFSRGEFLGLNVTIPYKQTVIPHLSEMDEAARQIGSVNTVVNRDGRLIGYNTDLYGMIELARHAGVIMKNKKVAILGTGGTSKTARAAAKKLSAREIVIVSRESGEGRIDYETLYREHADTEVIINTTPLGMFPNIYSTPLELDRLPALAGVLDAVYNPLRTELVLDAEERGIPAEGGLYMLVAQAVRASELFLDKKYPDGTADAIYAALLREKENTVLIGMPACGKSTVGKIIADKEKKPLVDTDELIVKKAGRAIPEIFGELGESAFRDIESEVIKECATLSGAVIATGGGAVLRRENVRELKRGGRLYFLDRSPELLAPTEDRPLSKTREAIEARYRERYPIYISAADTHVLADGPADKVANKIMKRSEE